MRRNPIRDIYVVADIKNKTPVQGLVAFYIPDVVRAIRLMPADLTTAHAESFYLATI